MCFTRDPVHQWSFWHESQGVTHTSGYPGAGDEGRNSGVFLHLIRSRAWPQLSQVLVESSQVPQGCWLFHYVQVLSCPSDFPWTMGTLSIQDLSNARTFTQAKENRGCLNQLNTFWQTDLQEKKVISSAYHISHRLQPRCASFLHFD